MPAPQDEARPYDIKLYKVFETEFARLVPDTAARNDLERGIRFSLRYWPEMGKFTGRSSPAPIYMMFFGRGHKNPPLVVYYCYWPYEVRVVGVCIASDAYEE